MERIDRISVKAYGVRGAEWSNYRHPLPEHMYDVYPHYWRDTEFIE